MIFTDGVKSSDSLAIFANSYNMIFLSEKNKKPTSVKIVFLIEYEHVPLTNTALTIFLYISFLKKITTNLYIASLVTVSTSMISPSVAENTGVSRVCAHCFQVLVEQDYVLSVYTSPNKNILTTQNHVHLQKCSGMDQNPADRG